MPITLTNAIYRSRSKLDEPAYPTLPNSTPGSPPARFYTDTEIAEWINDGLRDISRRAEDLITYDATIQIAAYGENPNQPIPVYQLPNDILRIQRVEFQVAGDSSQIYPLEASTQAYMDQYWNIDQISSLNYPGYWVTRGYAGGTGRNQFVIQLFPQCSQNGNLNIFYYRLPIRVSDPVANPTQYQVELDLLEGWDDLLIDYVVVQAKIKKRDPTFNIDQAAYEAKMVNIMDQTRRVSDQPQYFRYDNMLTPWGYDSWGGW